MQHTKWTPEGCSPKDLESYHTMVRYWQDATPEQFHSLRMAFMTTIACAKDHGLEVDAYVHLSILDYIIATKDEVAK